MHPFRTALAAVRLWKFRARRFWTTDVPDCFTLLDWLFVLAGVRLKSQNGGHRFAWWIYRLGGHLQMLASFVACVSSFLTGEDPLVIIWSTIMFVSEVMCLVKVNLVSRHKASIDELREFIGLEGYSSGDSGFERALRNRFQNRCKGVFVAVFSMMVVQQIVCWMPTDQQSRTFYTPPWIGKHLGEWAATLFQVTYFSWYVFVWLSKLYCCTIVSIVLMMGMQVEQKILVHHFGRFEEDLKDLRDKYHDSEQFKKQYWDRVKFLIKKAMNQQFLVLNKLREIQSLVETLFFYLYYFSLIALGSAFFIVVSEPMSTMIVGICGNVLFLAMECYLLTLLVEGLKDSVCDVSDHVFSICSQLPYSDDHRRDYFTMRTTLITVGHCSQNIVQFACPGIADISVQVFANLMNVSYSVLTFLLSVI